LADARDWAISRNRYWGTPLPIWASEDFEEIVVIGSAAELEKLSGRTGITDLHRHFIDDIEIPSQKGKGVLRRVSEVFDCWFESGSMPYAQQHYPFENKDKFEQSFPADFIAEGIDQTRGWFYTLMVISTALFDKPPFKNLIVNGLVLASDGKKMSKRLKNYPDPTDVINKYGADALRLYLINSPVVKAESLKFQEKGVSDVLKDVFLRWYNAYRFLVQNAIRVKDEGREFVYQPEVAKASKNVMDRWVLASTTSLIKFVRQEMEAYRLYTVVPRLVKFIEELANWYVRLNRDRLKGKDGLEQETLSLNTLALVLFTLCRAMGPFTPFFVENVYQNLKFLIPEAEREESVHYLSFPTEDASLIDEDIEAAVSRMQTVIELGRTARDRAKRPMKFPLRQMIIFHQDQKYLDSLKPLENFILSELNIKTVVYRSDMSSSVSLRAVPDFKRLGKTLRGDLKKVSEAITKLTSEQLSAFETAGEITLEGHKLTAEDIRVVREYKDNGDSKGEFEVAQEGDVFTVLGLEVDQGLLDEGVAREIMNRIQRLRKEIKLVVADSVVAFYNIPAKGKKPVSPGAHPTDGVVLNLRQAIEAQTNTPLLPASYKLAQHVVVGYSLTDVNEAPFELFLCRPEVGVNTQTVTNSDLVNYVLTLNSEELKKTLQVSGKITLKLNGKEHTLTLGQELYLSVPEFAKTREFKW
jgi:isoleucyl-tRNA synthetase